METIPNEMSISLLDKNKPKVSSWLNEENLQTPELTVESDSETGIQIPQQISDVPVPWLQYKYFQSMFI